jgi:hypothetical protein
MEYTGLGTDSFSPGANRLFSQQSNSTILDAARKTNDVVTPLNALLRRVAVCTHIGLQQRLARTISAPVAVMGALTVASLSAPLLLPPISQDQSYHQFADQRTILGIPNFWNVVSNFPLLRSAACFAILRYFQTRQLIK